MNPKIITIDMGYGLRHSRTNMSSYNNLKKSQHGLDNEEISDLNFRTLVKNGFKNLFKNGSLHGFKYITDNTMPLRERFVWFIICMISIVVCFWNIQTMWLTWIAGPFNMVMDDNFSPIYDIPFPSVIICPETRIKKSFVDLEKEADPVKLFAASLVCGNMQLEKYSLPQNYTGVNVDDQVVDFIKRGLPTCNEMIKRCQWMDIESNYEEPTDCCEEFFQPILIEEGICYGFNLVTHLNKSQYDSIENNAKLVKYRGAQGYGYAPNTTKSYPRRLFSAGDSYGLSIDLYTNLTESQTFCEGSGMGFKILIDNPIDFAISKSFIEIPTRKKITFSITPRKIDTDEHIIELEPKKRKCYDITEKTLGFFSKYSYNNCIADYVLKYTRKYCNCLPFYFTHLVNDTKICKRIQETSCMNNIKMSIQSEISRIYYSEKLGEKIEDTGSQKYSIDCLLSCQDIFYNSEIFYSDYHHSRSDGEIKKSNISVNLNEVALIRIGYKDSLFLGLHRHEVYDTMTFISAVGGVLSLFLGFSLMSMVEIFHYIIVQPILIWIKSKFNRNITIGVTPYLP